MNKLDKVLYRARSTATGGRQGTAVTSDGILKVTLTTPKEMGGDGAPGTNPEQLFATGYAACFLGAIKAVARPDKIQIPETDVQAEFDRRVIALEPPQSRQQPMHHDGSGT